MTEVKTATIVYKGEIIEGYVATSEGSVVNTTLDRTMATTFNQSRVVPYVPMTHNGKHIRPCLPVLIYNAFNKDNQVSSIRQLRFIDGNPRNTSIENIYRVDIPHIVTIKSKEINNENLDIELNEFNSDEAEFAKLQKKFIDLLGSNGIRKRIRQRAMEKVYNLFNAIDEETVEKYELEYIMEVQRSKSIYSLPLFTSETLLGIYQEYSDLLPVIDSHNIQELVYAYIEDMRSNAIISLDVKQTGTIVQLKDFSNNEITYSVNVDPLHPINSFLAIIRLRNVLKVSLNPETLFPPY